MTLPIVHPDREPMTEAEARRVGHEAQRMAQFRNILASTPLSATVSIKTNSGGAASLTLTQLETEALMGLLIERVGLFLASFNVIPEATI